MYGIEEMKKEFAEVKQDLIKMDAEFEWELANNSYKFDFLNETNKRTLGRCRKWNNGMPDFPIYTISLGSAVKTSTTEAERKNILMHELLHSIPEGMSHTGRWKAVAQKVNAFYAGKYHITRLEYLEDVQQQIVPTAKYVVKCEDCGITCAYTRRGKVFQEIYRQQKTNNEIEGYSCGRCKGKHLRAIVTGA